MSVWAITMVKDEVDVIEPVLRHVAAQGVDGIIVADNGSTDGTREAIEDADTGSAIVVYKEDNDPAYYQSRKMTALADEAHALGATWVWPFDADELWYYGDTAKLATVIEHADGDVIYARLWHHFPTALDAAGTNPFERMVYRGDEAPLQKVIVRWQPGQVITAGNHDVEAKGAPSTLRDVQVRHFPYRSANQFISKAINGSRAYAATDLPYGTGQHWREYGKLYEQGGEALLSEVFLEHFFYSLPSASGLVYDPARLDS